MPTAPTPAEKKTTSPPLAFSLTTRSLAAARHGQGAPAYDHSGRQVLPRKPPRQGGRLRRLVSRSMRPAAPFFQQVNKLRFVYLGGKFCHVMGMQLQLIGGRASKPRHERLEHYAQERGRLFPLTQIPLSFPRRQRYLAARTIAPRYRNSHLVPDYFRDLSYISVREPRTEQDRVNRFLLNEILAYLYCFCLIPHYNREELILPCLDNAPVFILVRIRSMSKKKYLECHCYPPFLHQPYP